MAATWPTQCDENSNNGKANKVDDEDEDEDDDDDDDEEDDATLAAYSAASTGVCGNAVANDRTRADVAGE